MSTLTLSVPRWFVAAALGLVAALGGAAPAVAVQVESVDLRVSDRTVVVSALLDVVEVFPQQPDVGSTAAAGYTATLDVKLHNADPWQRVTPSPSPARIFTFNAYDLNALYDQAGFEFPATTFSSDTRDGWLRIIVRDGSGRQVQTVYRPIFLPYLPGSELTEGPVKRPQLDLDVRADGRTVTVTGLLTGDGSKERAAQAWRALVSVREEGSKVWSDAAPVTTHEYDFDGYHANPSDGRTFTSRLVLPGTRPRGQVRVIVRDPRNWGVASRSVTVDLGTAPPTATRPARTLAYRCGLRNAVVLCQDPPYSCDGETCSYDGKKPYLPVAGTEGATAVVTTRNRFGRGVTCFIRADRTVGCLGDGSSGQLGDGTSPTAPALTPRTVAGLGDVVDIAAGTDHVCAVRASGTVACWGKNATGLGDGVSTTSTRPVSVQGIADAVEVETRGTLTCVRHRDGGASCWGPNAYGELGIGRTSSGSSRPVRVTGLADAVDLAVGTEHVCAARLGGAVSCWGSGVQNELGLGYPYYTPATAKVPTPTRYTGVDDAVAVFADEASSCALRANGQVACWGGTPGYLIGYEWAHSIEPTTVALDPPTAPLTAVVGFSMENTDLCALHGASSRLSCSTQVDGQPYQELLVDVPLWPGS